MTEERNEPEPELEFYTVSGIAQRWDCSEKHVRREIKKGNLVGHRFGKLVRVGDADLLRYERQNRKK